MKIVRSFAAVALFATVAFSASAQQKPAGAPATAPTTPQQTAVALPESKIAMIYSEEFLDPKAGIAKYNSLLNTLNREFQPRRTELEGLQQRINTLTKEINEEVTVKLLIGLRPQIERAADVRKRRQADHVADDRYAVLEVCQHLRVATDGGKRTRQLRNVRTRRARKESKVCGRSGQARNRSRCTSRIRRNHDVT